MTSMIEPEVRRILAAAPHFAGRYLALVAAADGDPGSAATFVELADYATDLVAAVERHRAPLVACLAGLEEVAAGSDNAEALVVWAFCDSLSPDDLRRLEPWLGPRTKALLDDVDRSPTT